MPNYKITVLEIARKTVDGAFYFGDFMPVEQEFPNPFSMTLLQGEGRNILIDTGIDVNDPVKQGIVKGAGLQNAHGPEEVLATVGLTCDDISAVILTHLHFDHAGALDCYHNAHFYLQSEEFEGWQMIAANPQYEALHVFCMDMYDLPRLDALLMKNRLTLLQGDGQLFPGVRVLKVSGGHSFASQMVLADTEKGRFLHVGDACNRPENLTGTKEFPFFLPNTKFGVGSPLEVVRGYDRILGLVGGNIDRLIMTHDDSRRDKFPWHDSELGLSVFEIA